MLFRRLSCGMLVFSCSLATILVSGMTVGANAQAVGGDRNFTLPSTSGNTVSLSDFRGRYVVLEWFNPGCPFVKKHYRSGQMQLLRQKARDEGFVWLAVNSTNTEHPDYADAPKLGAIASEWGFKGDELLLDSTGEVGRKFGAKTTPHMFILDREGKILYQGAIDSSPDTTTDPATSRNYIREAIEEIKAGKALQVSETEPYGCSVKYGS